MGVIMKLIEILPVWVTISEPWDTEIPDHQLSAELRVFADDGFLVKLDASFGYKQKNIEWLVAKPRHVGNSLLSMKAGETLSVNMVATKQEAADSENPLDLTWWRGGNAFIGELENR